MENERKLFIDEIKDVSRKDLGLIDSLFYRRVLSDTELGLIWGKIEKEWGASGTYWYPLGEKTHPSLIALGISKFDNSLIQRSIRSFLSKSKVDRVFEVRECGDENYEIDTPASNFIYTGAEGYWISEENNWIIYCSHERTITFGGTISKIAEQLTKRPLAGKFCSLAVWFGATASTPNLSPAMLNANRLKHINMMRLNTR